MDLSDAMDNTKRYKARYLNSKESFQRESFSWRRCQSDKSSVSIKIPLSLSDTRNTILGIDLLSEINLLPGLGRFRSNLPYFFFRSREFRNIERERDEK